MERRIISDDQLLSSSYLEPDRTKDHGRLNDAFAWCSSDNKSYPILTVDLRQTMSITGISVQGDSLTDSWVTKFWLRWSVDGKNVKYVLRNRWHPHVSNLRFVIKAAHAFAYDTFQTILNAQRVRSVKIRCTKIVAILRIVVQTGAKLTV